MLFQIHAKYELPIEDMAFFALSEIKDSYRTYVDCEGEVSLFASVRYFLIPVSPMRGSGSPCR